MNILKGPLRRAAELMSRNVVFQTRLPQRYGRRAVFVSPENNLAILKPGDAKFDSFLFRIVDRFVDVDSVVWDIGANMGIFSFAAAHIARRGMVVSVEPDPFNLLLLHRTRALPSNADLRIDIIPAAASHALGTAKLRIARRGRAANSLGEAAGSTQMGGIRDEFTVITVTLDWLLERFPAPNLVKCDTEGAEALVLTGSTRLLTNIRPAFVFELAKENAAACSTILAAHDYAAFPVKGLNGPVGEAVNLDGLAEVLTVPRERASHLGPVQRS